MCQPRLLLPCCLCSLPQASNEMAPGECQPVNVSVWLQLASCLSALTTLVCKTFLPGVHEWMATNCLQGACMRMLLCFLHGLSFQRLCMTASFASAPVHLGGSAAAGCEGPTLPRCISAQPVTSQQLTLLLLLHCFCRTRTQTTGQLQKQSSRTYQKHMRCVAPRAFSMRRPLQQLAG